jgi:hypothetical protein
LCFRIQAGAVGKTLEVIRAAARWDYPTGDIDRVLAEIEMASARFMGSLPPTNQLWPVQQPKSHSQCVTR